MLQPRSPYPVISTTNIQPINTRLNKPSTLKFITKFNSEFPQRLELLKGSYMSITPNHKNEENVETRHATNCGPISWYENHICGVMFQKKVSKTETSNEIPRIVWDAITCLCLWHLLLTQHFSFVKDRYEYIYVFTNYIRKVSSNLSICFMGCGNRQ